MIAAELISQILAPLKSTDRGEEALTIMNIYHVKHLPIVDDTMLQGMISEEDILNHNNIQEPIGNYLLSTVKPYVHHRDHLFEVMSKMAKSRLTVVPVIDDDEQYIGLITQEDILQYYAKSFSFQEPGSILMLETDRRNYALSEIARIVESENAIVLSSFLSSNTDSTNVLVTIKLNVHEIQTIVAAFQRFDYTIKATFTEQEYFDGLQDRYDGLMKYLSV